VINATSTIVIKGKFAQPLKSTVVLPRHQVDSDERDRVTSSSRRPALKILSTLNLLPASGRSPSSSVATPRGPAPDSSHSAQPADVTTTTVPLPPTTSPVSSATTPVGPQAGGSNVLPVTGSSPWPLFVVGASAASLGLLALAGARRRRRPLQRS